MQAQEMRQRDHLLAMVGMVVTFLPSVCKGSGLSGGTETDNVVPQHKPHLALLLSSPGHLQQTVRKIVKSSLNIRSLLDPKSKRHSTNDQQAITENNSEEENSSS
jgi:hypothetical protein